MCERAGLRGPRVLLKDAPPSLSEGSTRLEHKT
ncbi:hypothetical protein R69749_04640 [Paraburkholderia domus]|uniref:Uncharacterized protein n=1 Tax=Paraburkholderia domus TaxID=2793075 RepID=A0A9N8MVM0_9BURK|nr:hypothetical protein R70006_03003 [Paraburkholderia domus]CAE6818633.1 hypothetical protein R75483_06133 [Paraburkholderia domus]CAE6845113.1 hypothetical protein R69749_04640 [Paraburkholderia domus]CAE6909382.1 hypothetical protein R70211_03808 [Paraburkholderia domus]CAE6912413.1 hypothetical protein R70199_04394 [Paraburkholderia domus]